MSPGRRKTVWPAKTVDLGKFAGHALAERRGRPDDVDAGVEARLGREAQAPGQVDVLLEGILGRRGQAGTDSDSLNAPASTSATEMKTKFL